MNLSHVNRTWYPACQTNELNASPKRTTIADHDLCLFRDSRGQPNAVSNVCPHRGAPLHKGVVRADEIQCPYHGWCFSGCGRLRFVPSDAEGTARPSQPILPSFPTQDRGGFVWVFFDPETNPSELHLLSLASPIPTVPELEQGGEWFCTYGEYEFDAPWQPVFENALDNSHIHFLHGDSFGNAEKPETIDVKTETFDAFAESKFTLHNKPPNFFWKWTETPAVNVTARAYLPSVSYIRFDLARVSFLTYVATVPIGPDKTVNRYVLGRTRFPGRVFDPFARRAMDKIFGEDRAMIEQLYPPGSYKERSVRADELQLAWRSLVKRRV